MNKMIVRILFVIFGLSLQCTINAVTYYVDSSRPDDSGNGTSPATAWKTIAKVNQQTFQPGDQLLFKRGQTWYGEKIVLTGSGTTNSPILISSYGTGQRPVIDSRDAILNWTNAGSWTDCGNNIWRIILNNSPVRLWLDGVEYVQANENAPDPLSLVDSQYRWYKLAQTYLYVYSSGNPATAYSSMIGLRNSETIYIGGNHNIEISNLDLRGGFNGCIYILGASNISIHHCNIGYNRNGVYARGQTEGSYIECDNISIKNCIIDSKANYSYNYEYYNLGDGIYFCNGVINSTVCNNEILDWGHTGINLYGANDNFQYGVSYNSIYENIISAENISYGRGLEIAGLDNKATGNKMYRNVVKNTTVRNQIGGNDNFIYNNLITGIESSPCRPYAIGQGILLSSASGGSCHDCYVFNNTIADCQEAGIFITGGNPGDASKYNIAFICNNIIDCGYDPADSAYDNAGIVILNTTFSVPATSYIKNNIYDSISSSECIYYRTASMTVPDFNDCDGDNGDVIKSNTYEELANINNCGASEYENEDNYYSIYSFNEKIGLGYAYDSSTSGRHGTLTFSATHTDGVYGGAIQFDSDTSHYIDCGDNFDPGTEYTISGWIKANGSGVAGRHIIECGNMSSRGFMVQLYSNNYLYAYQSVGGDIYALYRSAAFPHDGQFHHFAVSVKYVDGETTLTLYLDGVKQSSLTTAGSPDTPSSSDILKIGSKSQCILDEIKINKVAIENGQQQKDITAYAESMIFAWNFNEGQGTEAVNLIDNAFSGTLYNGSWTSGMSGQALQFPYSTSSYLNCGTGFDPGMEYTICGWIKPCSSEKVGRRIIQCSDISSRGFLVQLYSNDRLYVYQAADDSLYTAYTSAAFPHDDAFHHFAFTFKYDGYYSTLQLYIDGEMAVTTTHSGVVPTLPASSDELLIGYRSECIIDDLLIFNTVLDEKRLQLLISLRQ